MQQGSKWRRKILIKKSRLKEIKISGYKSLGTDTQPINLVSNAGKHDDGCVADLCWEERIFLIAISVWV